MSPVTGINFALSSYEKFQPAVSEMRKGQRSRGRALAPNSRNKAINTAKHKIFNFRAFFQAVSLLQLNGILMMWKIQQLMQDDAMRTARIYPTVHPSNRELKCSYGKISGRLYRDLGSRAGPPYIKIKIELILVYPRST